MGEDPKVLYRPRPEATPEEEARALAAVYRFVLQVHAERQKGAGAGTLEHDVKETNNVPTAK